MSRMMKVSRRFAVVLSVIMAVCSFGYSVAANSFSVTQITDNSYDDYEPQIDNGKVVWTGDEIYLYDISSSITTQLSSGHESPHEPQIDNGWVIWTKGKQWGIYLYDAASGITTLIADDGHTPDVKDGKAAWDTTWNGIYLYDIPSGTTTRLTNDGYDDDSPKIDNGLVVW